MKKLYVYKPKFFEPQKFHNCPSYLTWRLFFSNSSLQLWSEETSEDGFPMAVNFHKFYFSKNNFGYFTILALFFRQITLHTYRAFALMSGQQLALFDRKWRGRLPHGCQFAYEFLSRQLLLIKLCASFFNPKLNTFLGVGFAIICVPTDFLKNFDTKKFQMTTSQWLSIFTSFTFHKMNLDLSLIWHFFSWDHFLTEKDPMLSISQVFFWPK